MPDAYDYLREDDVLGPLVETHGPLTLKADEAFFPRFVISILRQQVSMASAGATRERLFDALEVTPEGVLAADEQVLLDAGLSKQKAHYVGNVAEAFLERGYSRDYFADMSETEVIDELTSITGVGIWTAKMQLMFSLERPDVFPVEDLGIRKGMNNLFGGLSRAEMVETAERWRPYRSYASLYVWRAQDDIPEAIAGSVQE